LEVVMDSDDDNDSSLDDKERNVKKNCKPSSNESKVIYPFFMVTFTMIFRFWKTTH